MNDKCVSCHGPSKKEGDLRVDTFDGIMAGGEGGPAVEANAPEKSLLYTLCALAPDDDDIMPPKGKPFTKAQQDVIKWWIEKGAPKSGTLASLKPSQEMMDKLLTVKITAAPKPKPKKKKVIKKKEPKTEEPKKEEPKVEPKKEGAAIEIPAILKDKAVFLVAIKPILDFSCISCHGSKKKPKGKLKLDSIEGIKKGGSDGDTFVAGNLDESLSYFRMTIDPADDEDDEIMPPVKKKEMKLSKDQIALFKWWIEQGASYDKKLADLKATPAMLKIITEAALNPPKEKE
jgi:ribosomal protein S16